MSPIRDLHSMVDIEEVRGSMMPVHKWEIDKMSKSQRRTKLLAEPKSTGADRSGPGREANYQF